VNGDESGLLRGHRPLGLRAISRSVVAPIMAEIEGLASLFSSFAIKHVIRAANSPAHLCVKFACTLEITCCWMGTSHSFLTSSVFVDCADGVVE
jgi:hypothetical protein